MTMLERVARALDEFFPEGQWKTGGNPPTRMTQLLARAAIEALREPTKEMLVAGDGQCGVYRHGANTWSAMIDAALAEKP